MCLSAPRPDVFPGRKVIEFQHCGNMWELCNLCHASFYKYHHSQFFPSRTWHKQREGHLRLTAMKWQSRPPGPEEAGGGRRGVGGRKIIRRPKGNIIQCIVNLTIILSCSALKMVGEIQVHILSSWHATWRHGWLKICNVRHYATYRWVGLKVLYPQTWPLLEHISNMFVCCSQGCTKFSVNQVV